MVAPQGLKWEEEFAQVGAYWRHNGDPTRPHAILSSGKHSDGYLDCSKIICQPPLLQATCQALVAHVQLKPGPDWVIGSAFGSILVAYELGRQLHCRAGFTERPATASLQFKRFEVGAGNRVLVATTALRDGGGVEQTLAALRAKGTDVGSKVAAIVNLSGAATIGSNKVVALDANEVYPWLPHATSAADPYDELISHPNSLESACRRIAARLPYPQPAWVVGAGTTSIPTAYELAKLLQCRAGFTEPASDGALDLRRFQLEPGAHVLVCEDVLTTGGTTGATIAALQANQAEVLGHCCAIANRSGMPKLDQREIVSLLQPQFNVWETTETCPLCAQGSEAIRPKGNWAQLTQAAS